MPMTALTMALTVTLFLRASSSSAARWWCRVADCAVEIHGGTGNMHGLPVERLYRDARIFRFHGGTNEVQKLIIT